MTKIMDKLYLVHGNTWYDGYGYCENLYGVFTDRKTAEKVKSVAKIIEIAMSNNEKCKTCEFRGMCFFCLLMP